MNLVALGNIAAALVLAPLLPGFVQKTKAYFGGRTGPPLFQLYFDLFRLLRKGEVVSRTTTWIFRVAPSLILASTIIALALLPMAGRAALLPFSGDLVLFAYLLGLARFAMVLAALDTGSSFEGMGASREVAFAALAEPAFLVGLAALARLTGSLSLSDVAGAIDGGTWLQHGPVLALVVAALFVVYLAENARIPVDDPATHLELTMIHEVMILDHSGPDLAFLEYASALKLWLLGSVLLGIVLPLHSGDAFLDAVAFTAGMISVAVATGVVESTMARLRLVRVPSLLAGAVALSAIALLLGGI